MKILKKLTPILLVCCLACLSRHIKEDFLDFRIVCHQKHIFAQQVENRGGYEAYYIKAPIYIKLFGVYDGYEELTISTQIGGSNFIVGNWIGVWSEKHSALMYPLSKQKDVEGLFYNQGIYYTHENIYLHIKVDVVIYRNDEEIKLTKITKVRILGV